MLAWDLYLVLGIWCLVLSTWYLVLGTGHDAYSISLASSLFLMREPSQEGLNHLPRAGKWLNRYLDPGLPPFCACGYFFSSLTAYTGHNITLKQSENLQF